MSATRDPKSVIAPDLAKYVQYSSPRASIALQQASKVLALMNGRGYVIPEDIKQLGFSVLRYRIILNFEVAADQVHLEVIINAILNTVTTP